MKKVALLAFTSLLNTQVWPSNNPMATRVTARLCFAQFCGMIQHHKAQNKHYLLATILLPKGRMESIVLCVSVTQDMGLKSHQL